jgi:hypothetical protein
MEDRTRREGLKLRRTKNTRRKMTETMIPTKRYISFRLFCIS